jgi:RNA methyltransferase, TrmH family
MLAKEIKSLQHPLIKNVVKIRENKQYRQEKRLVFVYGKKMVFEIAKKKAILTLFFSDKNLSLDPLKPKELFFVTKDIMKKISNVEEPEDIAAIFQMPDFQNLDDKKYILVLDKISDPGNLGTIIRSSLSLNWDGIIITPNTVDPFNDKALRAAKGATFFIPINLMTEDEIKKMIIKNKIHAYIADLNGENFEKVKFSYPLMLILSSESKGPSFWTKELKKITIPMKDFDSLNVAIAGSILLYYMRKNG